jgi:adenylate cyclase
MAISDLPNILSTGELRPHVEYERRFLVKAMPPPELLGEGVEMEQGYLGNGLRLRREGDAYVMARKLSLGGVPIEIPKDLTKEEFDNLWPGTEGRRVRKTRYKVPHGTWTIEVNVLHGALEGAVIAEAEAKPGQEIADFIPPEWLGEEVTHDLAYTMSMVSRHGFPGLVRQAEVADQ